MSEYVTISQLDSIRVAKIYEVAKFSYKNMKKGETIKSIYENIAKDFQLKNWRSVSNIVARKKQEDLPFQQWLKENKKDNRGIRKTKNAQS